MSTKVFDVLRESSLINENREDPSEARLNESTGAEEYGDGDTELDRDGGP